MASRPEISFMDGADLVKEGILTLTKAIEYLHDGGFENKDNPATLLAKFLLDGDIIKYCSRG